MIKQINYYIGEETNPHYNLAVEQYLMETVAPDTCILYLWQNKHTVVIGRNQNAWKECRTEELKQQGGHLARRLSGGGAVFHDMGNLNFTFLVSKKEYDLDKQLDVISKACESFGLTVTKSGRNDLLAEGRKFSGNAYYDSHGQAYHHGTLLINVDMSMLSKYLKPSKAKLESKGVDSVSSRVINLTELCPDITIEKMCVALIRAFEEVYNLTATPLTQDTFDVNTIDEYTRRNESWDWLYGKKIPFTFSFGKRFSWGELEVQANVNAGILKEVAVYTDSMDWNLTTELTGALTNCPMDLLEMQSRIQAIDCPSDVREDIIELIKEQEI